MTNRQLIDWLLENGGPVIRYRVARELLAETGKIDLGEFSEALIKSPLVQTWLKRLGCSTEINQLHSSQVTAFENVMGKLVQSGCHQGIALFDQRTRPYRSWLGSISAASQPDWTPFKRKIVGSFLVAAGYHQEDDVQNYITNRLDTLWRFTCQRDFDIFTDRKQYPDIPKGFKDKPLVKPALYSGDDARFPYIYDLIGLANYPVRLLDQDAQQKIDSVIEYILDPKYQAFPEGYGLMRAGKGKYYAIGWSVHLPRYYQDSGKIRNEKLLIQRLELMSNFGLARSHRWFKESIQHLERFRTDSGTYIFPRSYLQERPSGYWVTGAYMGLEQNRRNKIAIELESTFWMLKIKKNANQDI